MMQPFEPRPIAFHGIRQVGAWRLKLYSIVLHDAAVRLDEFEPAIRLAEASLPPPDPARGRPGLGFLIAHQGRTGNYLVLAYWNHENELPLRVWVRRSSSETWRAAEQGESICVWDLEIIWAERQAWVRTMLVSPQRPPEEYLADICASCSAAHFA